MSIFAAYILSFILIHFRCLRLSPSLSLSHTQSFIPLSSLFLFAIQRPVYLCIHCPSFIFQVSQTESKVQWLNIHSFNSLPRSLTHSIFLTRVICGVFVSIEQFQGFVWCLCFIIFSSACSFSRCWIIVVVVILALFYCFTFVFASDVDNGMYNELHAHRQYSSSSSCLRSGWICI